jgi:hypothetical protein
MARKRHPLSRHQTQIHGTRSDLGRDARDTFLALAKTCAKLGISFWNYLGARLNIPAAIVPPLPQLIPSTAAPL